MQPNFLGIGAQKCATTWLHAILLDHPEVALPSKQKEIDFFSYHYTYGFQWYERQFDQDRSRTMVGEVSPSYFCDAQVPERVAAYDSKMRLILLLRDPVERAFSNHKHEVRTGHLIGDDLSFEFGLKNNPTYVQQGLYATHLQRWLNHFPKEQMLVVLFDDIQADARSATQVIYRFLGIDDRHIPAALEERANESHVIRYTWLERIRRGGRGAIEAIGLRAVWDGLARLGARRLYRRINRKSSDFAIPPMAESSRQQLKMMFEAEVRSLEDLLGRSLEIWY